MEEGGGEKMKQVKKEGDTWRYLEKVSKNGVNGIEGLDNMEWKRHFIREMGGVESELEHVEVLDRGIDERGCR